MHRSRGRAGASCAELKARRGARPGVLGFIRTWTDGDRGHDRALTRLGHALPDAPWTMLWLRGGACDAGAARLRVVFSLQDLENV